MEPRRIPRQEHAISRKNISKEALKVLYRLHRFGFKGYLVGGGVRDLLLGKRPKDYDVATDARPNRLKKIFRNCRIIGRRFRIAHVFFPNDMIIEVTTFRRGSEFAEKKDNGLILRDNTFGTPEEDAVRRDLTINGLFYDIADFSVIDYVGGMEDLKRRIIRTIADPVESFREDPVRMIRAVRHAARTGFTIEPKTLAAIRREKGRILLANPSRLLEELYRDLRGGAAVRTYAMLAELGLLRELLPELADGIEGDPDHPAWRRLEGLDALMAKGREFANPVLLAAALGTVLFPSSTGEDGKRADLGREIHARLRPIAQRYRVSRRDAERVGQILLAQRKLRALGNRTHLPAVLRKKVYLPFALDFYEILRRAEGEQPGPLRSWRRLAREEAKAREALRAEEKPRAERHRRRRRRPARRRRKARRRPAHAPRARAP